jgi:hypothetical protein
LQWAGTQQRKRAFKPLATQLLSYFIRIALVDAEHLAVRPKFDFCLLLTLLTRGKLNLLEVQVDSKGNFGTLS